MDLPNPARRIACISARTAENFLSQYFDVRIKSSDVLFFCKLLIIVNSVQ